MKEFVPQRVPVAHERLTSVIGDTYGHCSILASEVYARAESLLTEHATPGQFDVIHEDGRVVPTRYEKTLQLTSAVLEDGRMIDLVMIGDEQSESRMTLHGVVRGSLLLEDFVIEFDTPDEDTPIECRHVRFRDVIDNSELPEGSSKGITAHNTNESPERHAGLQVLKAALDEAKARGSEKYTSQKRQKTDDQMLAESAEIVQQRPDNASILSTAMLKVVARKEFGYDALERRAQYLSSAAGLEVLNGGATIFQQATAKRIEVKHYGHKELKFAIHSMSDEALAAVLVKGLMHLDVAHNSNLLMQAKVKGHRKGHTIAQERNAKQKKKVHVTHNAFVDDKFSGSPERSSTTEMVVYGEKVKVSVPYGFLRRKSNVKQLERVKAELEARLGMDRKPRWREDSTAQAEVLGVDSRQLDEAWIMAWFKKASKFSHGRVSLTDVFPNSLRGLEQEYCVAHNTVDTQPNDEGETPEGDVDKDDMASLAVRLDVMKDMAHTFGEHSTEHETTLELLGKLSVNGSVELDITASSEGLVPDDETTELTELDFKLLLDVGESGHEHNVQLKVRPTKMPERPMTDYVAGHFSRVRDIREGRPSEVDLMTLNDVLNRIVVQHSFAESTAF